ncbi:MAG TPA: AAA family ATPase [Candidatus Limnocylindrales bacterium]|nr:AAA family ATPase [Candidatus Limnocylindrales bacterium]
MPGRLPVARAGSYPDGVPAPFVGRQRELRVLRSLSDIARRERRPTAALVTGDPGSGKTRLLAELCSHSPMPVERVHGFEPTQAVPLAAARELLRRLARVPAAGADLDRLVVAREQGPLDALRIFEAAHLALRRHGPLLVAVDDLQWVDEASRALLVFLVRAAGSTSGAVSVVVAARPSAEATSLRSALETELPEPRRAVIGLGPLSREEGTALARAIDPTLASDEGSALWQRAAGSPFWVEVLARGRGGDEPARLIEDRLVALGADAGMLLAALAVGARPFAVEQVAAVLDWPVERAAFAARELVGRGLVVSVAGTLRLAHDLIRDAAVREMPADRRRRLHDGFAAWIEAAAGEDPSQLCEALGHRQEADLPSAALALRVLTSPQRRLLSEANVRLLVSIADRLTPGSPQQVELDVALAAIAARLGLPELARARWNRAAVGSTDVRLRQEAAVESAHAAYALDRGDEVHADLDRALAIAEPAPELAIRIGALRAETQLWLDHRTAAGAETAAATLALAEQLAAARGGLDRLDPPGRAAYLRALESAGDAALQEDRGADVLRVGEIAVEVARGLDDEAYLAALTRTAFALRPLGRMRESTERYQEAWDRARAAVLPMAMVEAGHGLARGLRDLGRLPEARAVALETVQLEERLRTAPRRWGTAPTILHQIELVMGEPGALERLEADTGRERDPHFRIGIHQTVAMWRARAAGTRETERILASVEAARDAADVSGCPRCGFERTLHAAATLARIGRVDAARAELERLPTTWTPGYLLRDVWQAQARAAIAHAAGQRDEAIERLRAAIAMLDAAGMRTDLAWAWVDLADALGPEDRTEAVNALTRASELAVATGAGAVRRVAAQRLRSLGVRAWRRGRGTIGPGLSALSEREREVATLVAEGRSNREIADALLLSPKTVERHVTNLLAKLGLRNRVEVAATLAPAPVRGSPDE